MIFVVGYIKILSTIFELGNFWKMKCVFHLKFNKKRKGIG